MAGVEPILGFHLDSPDLICYYTAASYAIDRLCQSDAKCKKMQLVGQIVGKFNKYQIAGGRRLDPDQLHQV